MLAEESLNFCSLYYVFVYALSICLCFVKASYHFWKVSVVAFNPLSCRAASLAHRIVWDCTIKKINGVHKQCKANTSYMKELYYIFPKLYCMHNFINKHINKIIAFKYLCIHCIVLN